MLHQRHADAPDHAADALAARRLGIHDAAGPVGADDAPHARLTEIGIDRDFHEHGAEGMHRESLALLARFHLGRSLDWLTDSAHGVRNVAAATVCERILARLAASGLHGAADARHGHRASVYRRPREPSVAEYEFHPLDRKAERLCGDLRHRC